MRKGRGRPARLVTVFLALLVALILTGMGYGAWSDTLTISGTVNTGFIDTEILWLYSETDARNTGFIWGEPTGMTFDVHAVNIQEGRQYYCVFSIDNTSTSTLPIKIESITITPAVADWPAYPPYGFNGSVKFSSVLTTEPDAFTTYSLTPDMVIGQQLHTGDWINGRVHVFLNGAPASSNFDVTIEVNVVIWNQ